MSLPELLDSLCSASTLRVVGLMSGTSFDGVDALLVDLSGSEHTLQVDTVATRHIAYPSDLKKQLHALSTDSTISLDDLTRLQGRLSAQYAVATRALLKAADSTLSDVDLVGVHGQTLAHCPTPASHTNPTGRGTLQLGAPGALAALLDCPVIGDFRPADMALGGQGAPIVPYLDYMLLGDANETRLMLNLGGIANLTVVPANGTRQDIHAFDTGPANMVMDALASSLLNMPYDADGAHAQAGSAHAGVVADLLQDPFFQQPPPRSTGRRQFGASFAEQLWKTVREAGGSPDDALATAALLTSASVYQAYAQFVRPEAPAERVLVSGGGLHNKALMHMLRDAFAPIPVVSTATVGVDPDMKEALCMAVLAYEWVNGVATAMPSVTGASASARLGGLHLPPRFR